MLGGPIFGIENYEPASFGADAICTDAKTASHAIKPSQKADQDLCMSFKRTIPSPWTVVLNDTWCPPQASSTVNPPKQNLTERFVRIACPFKGQLEYQTVSTRSIWLTLLWKSIDLGTKGCFSFNCNWIKSFFKSSTIGSCSPNRVEYLLIRRDKLSRWWVIFNLVLATKLKLVSSLNP